MSSMKKFLLSSLVCACAFLFLFGSTACVTINYINSQSSTSQDSSSSGSSSQSSSNSSSTSQDSSSSGSSSQDSTDDNSGNTGNKPEPTPLDANDLADTKYAYTKIINDWVVHSTLTQQSSFTSGDSNYALKGSFNYKSGTPYTANGANSIWTTPCFDLEEYYGSAQNLQGKSVSFDVKIENTSSEAAVSIMRTDNTRQAEHILNLKPYAAFSNVSIVKETLNDEWVRFTVNLDLLFSTNLLTDVKYIVLVFSNVGCNEEIDSVYYVDNMSIENDDSGNTGNKPEPTPLDANDLADTKYAYTNIINDWVVHSTLTQQSSFASEDSNYALKGSFNYKSGTPYTANGANSIWTTPCFDLEEYYGSAQNLQGKSVSFDVKIENTSSEAAVSIMRTDGIRQTEHILNLKPYAAFSNVSIVKETLNDEWVRFTVNLDLLFSTNLLTDVKYIVLVFSNVGCNEEIDSVYYVDNMSIENATPLEWYTDSYNPDGYYSKNETLNIHLAGNSFIYYSNTAGWLNTIATLNNANLTASFTWVPNGRIPNQYEEAFSLYGYLNENYQPNLLYIQDFYDFNDAFALNSFAEKLMEISPDTELKIYTAENETTDGLLAGENMGLDVVNWRALIKDLKTRGFTTEHLNDARDGWHPNELSGVIGAILIYMDLYGEIPNIDTLFEKMQITSDNFYSTTLTNYLPGTTSQEKYNSLSLIFDLAAAYANL